MHHAFIVTLDVGSDTDLPTIALELQDDLENSDYSVLSVAPWASPSTLGQPSPTPPVVTGQQTKQ